MVCLLQHVPFRFRGFPLLKLGNFVSDSGYFYFTLHNCATIETAQVKKDEVVFTGEIPVRCIQAYHTDLAFYTNGRSVCLTELKGYQAAVGEPVIQPRRPNSRLDKVRHMFQKVM